MTPDTSPADVFTWIGTAIGAAVAAWGLRHGAKDKDKAPIATSEAAAIAAASIFDVVVQRQIRDDTTRTADGVATLVHLLKEQIALQEERMEQAERQEMKDELAELKAELAVLRGGAEHKPGRPLRDPGTR